MNNCLGLPPELQKAQAAIDLPEVQEMLKRLATYNLGICMPHMHTKEQDFAFLPAGVVQVERDLRVNFHSEDQVSALETVPVAWRWTDDGQKPGVRCAAACYVINTSKGNVHMQK